ncbi:MAG: type I DNA topoisomerase [Candidatus Berkelbacteria bacterium]|nr:MAG: type I DNA topoisomerase [Candidatus Berkelbacteria bacterium]QQG51450.1 MAG: type I DNA topoisomerase [Candidatus Berkelbacteria bacterium]
MKKLVIVESPAKAKTISQYLGSDYVVKASYGHVRDLPKSKLGIDVEHNYSVDYLPIAKAKTVVSELREAVKKTDELYLATDFDREGEAIAWHLTELLKPKSEPKRITFHEITKSAIQEAIDHPRTIDADLVDAQQARRILDRLVGYKLSPFLWKKVYRGLSAGRVQSVAVRLIVEREREISEFKTREFWTLDATLKSKNGEFDSYVSEKSSTKPLEVEKRADIEKLAAKLKGASLKVSSVETADSQLNPQPPLITSTLQQQSARFCHFAAKKTMKIAQDLYEGVDIAGMGTVALITYMRTDSYNLAEQARKQAASVIVSDFGAKYAPAKPNVYTKKVRGAQEAHEAIRPTNFNLSPTMLKDKLDRDHFKLYELIWRAAMASQMTPAKVETTTATIESGDGTKLIARGRDLKFEGFLKVFPDDEERFVALPELAEGESVTFKKLEPTQHFTQPPARYSEATLVKELEKRGIGRPSTYAPTMSTIVERGYVTKQVGRFVPEDVAGIVNDLLVEHFPTVVDFNFTAEMEDELDDIAEGKKKLNTVLDEFYKPFAELLAKGEKTVDKKSIVEEKTDEKCPECHKPLVIKLGRYGKFYACTGFPECKYTAPITENMDKDEQKAVDEQEGGACEKCKDGKLVLKQGRFGTFFGCSNYPKCKFTKALVIASSVPCPNCGKELVRKMTRRGKAFWGCSGYPSCKTAFWDEPTSEKCPQCSNILVKKRAGLACSQCDYTKEPAGASPEVKS